MKTYAMPEVWNESQVRTLHKVRRWVIGISAPIFLISLYLWLHFAGRPADIYHAVWFGSMIALVIAWNPYFRKNRYKEVAERSRVHSIEIGAGGLRLNFLTWSKFIPWNEITQIQEPPNGRGMYLRTRTRFRWYLIPRKTDRYDEIKSELAAMGVPMAETSRPRGWSILIAGLALYCAPVLCTFLTQNRTLLMVNFAFALALGVIGIFFAKRIGDRHLKLRTMLGSFLPAIFSALALITPFGMN